MATIPAGAVGSAIDFGARLEAAIDESISDAESLAWAVAVKNGYSAPPGDGEQPIPSAIQLDRSRQRLRTLAAEFFLLDGRVEGLPKFNESDQKAADYITKNPGSSGKKIATAIHVDFAHFRTRIVPKLKTYGFTNSANREGYFPPPTTPTE